ncbi:hypothetical protein HOP50_05g37070 [Chloropicon primus]|nr:hypothetical protein HOP50_05g37070 [Chloropicon primus]|mmetsp:Transcript_4286/g.9533  ORF Transcript_4286/g.9533 Transcript_4286/m.9533 type:complete len:202 (+) Transcript_4286:308-913(+)
MVQEETYVEHRIFMNPVLQQRKASLYSWFCVQPYFCTEFPVQLQDSFTAAEWNSKIIGPLNEISLMIFPPLRLLMSLVFIPLGLFLCVLTRTLPRLLIILFCSMAFLGLLNGFLTSTVVADLYFQRLTVFLNDYFAEERDLRFAFITSSSRSGMRLRASYLGTERYLSIRKRRIRQELITDEMIAVGVVSPNNTYSIALPV